MMEGECLGLKDLTSPGKTTKLDWDDDGGENEQKENICTAWRRSTPLKVDATVPMILLARKAPTPDLVHITPIKHPERGLHPEPWSPTANLKMLISAASPDIRDREMKKMLFRPIENEQEKALGPEKVVEEEDTCQFEVVEEEAEEDGERKPSRKQKSLGLLCHKFLDLYPDYPPANDSIRISLDEVATSLGVERRRIYDIVNVLESLMIVGRLAKNRYLWYGRQRLAATLNDLQLRGRQLGYHLHMDQAVEGRETGAGREEAGTAPGTEDGGDGDSGNGAASNRKDKSLRIMSQKFVMLFLVSKTQTVTLDVAAKILIEESQDSSSHSKYKTKVRRLYDIANVLTSLSLIKKVHVHDERGRKPAFQWIGPAEFNNSTVDVAAITVPEANVITQRMTAQVARQPKLARHASFNITPTYVVSQRQVNSAPSSPRREITGQLPQPVDYSSKSKSSSPVCRLQFGSTTDTQPSAGLQTPTHRGSPLLHSSNQFTHLAVPIHHEGPFHSHLHHHHLAYLPSLSQPSVVMLYGGPTVPAEKLDHIPKGQRSPTSAPRESGKRKREEEDGERDLSEERVKTSVVVGREEGDNAQTRSPRTGSPSHPGGLSGHRPPSRTLCDGEVGKHSPSDLAQPSHYLYVPNSAGLNSLNFLLSAGQSPGGLTLAPGSMSTLALPYILVPSTALSHYPLVANGHQPAGTDGHAGLNFNLPAMMSPAHFVVGTAGPYGIAGSSELGGSLTVQSPSTPEQTRLYGSAPVPPHSPLGPRQQLGTSLTEPQTPHTPKEAVAPGSEAFFQTPGTLGCVVTAAPVTRKRGSAQRRLDIGHPPAN